MPMHNLSPRNASAAAPAGVTQYTDGATMDAAATQIGDYLELVGATTGERIALLEVGQTSPVKYLPRSPIDFRQSNGGVEFTGVLAFEALGTGSVPSWASSTPGSATVGGPTLAGTGCCKLNGLMPLNGLRRIVIKCRGYLDTRLAAVTSNWIAAGAVSDSDDAVVNLCGHGKSGTGWANGACVDGVANLPVPSFNTNFAAQPDEDEVWTIEFSQYPYNGAPPAGVQVQGGMVNDGQGGISAASNDANNALLAKTDIQPCFGVVGASVKYHINQLMIWCD